MGQAIRNIAALIAPEYALADYVLAGGAKDGVEQNGVSIDREDFHSAALVIAARASLASSQTATIEVTVQDSADGSTFADVANALQPGAAAPPGTVISLAEATATLTGLYELALDLSSLRRYIRVQIEVTLSAGSTDFVTYGCTLVRGGGVVTPIESL